MKVYICMYVMYEGEWMGVCGCVAGIYHTVVTVGVEQWQPML